MNTIKNHKKLITLFGALFISSIAVGWVGAFTMPVIDTANIRQQLKTYLETVKVYQNQVQQLSLQAQNMLKMPTEYINQLHKEVATDMAEVKKAEEATKSLLHTAKDVPNQWKENFFTLTDKPLDAQTIQGANEANEATEVKVSLLHKESLQELHLIQEKLDKAQGRLEELSKIEPRGMLEAQQIANEIEMTKATISTLHSKVETIQGKMQIANQELELTKSANRNAVVKADAARNAAYVEQQEAEYKAYHNQ